MYKHDTLFFIHLLLFHFFLVKIISILLLRYDKGKRFRIFYICSISIKFGVKKVCFPKAVTLARGILESLLTCSSYQ